MLNPRRMRWVSRVTQMREVGNAYNILTGKLERLGFLRLGEIILKRILRMRCKSVQLINWLRIGPIGGLLRTRHGIEPFGYIKSWEFLDRVRTLIHGILTALHSPDFDAYHHI
jgi:hypothetical protein